MTDQASKDVSEATDDTRQSPPPFRSRVVRKMPNLVADFPNMGFEKGKKVYVKGGRGSMGPWEIVEVLGSGKYKLKDGNKLLDKIFDEKDLSARLRLNE